MAVVKVFVSTSSFGTCDLRPLELLEAQGVKYELNPEDRTLTEQEIASFLRGKDGLVAGTEPLTRTVMEANPDVRVISRVGVGLDNVDLEAARELGISVYNTPDAPTPAVAEYALGMILALLRRIVWSDAALRAGRWEKTMGDTLCGKCVGIVGFGRIGRKLGGMLDAVGCRLVVFDPFEHYGGDVPVEQVGSIGELLERAAVVSLNLAYSESVHHLIGATELAQMRPGAVLVSTSRGGIVDEDALYEALVEGRIAGAALDVFEKEPYEGPLRELKNVVLTPHVGGYARECRAAMEEDAVKNLLEGFGLS